MRVLRLGTSCVIDLQRACCGALAMHVWHRYVARILRIFCLANGASCTYCIRMVLANVLYGCGVLSVQVWSAAPNHSPWSKSRSIISVKSAQSEACRAANRVLPTSCSFCRTTAHRCLGLSTISVASCQAAVAAVAEPELHRSPIIDAKLRTRR